MADMSIPLFYTVKEAQDFLTRKALYDLSTEDAAIFFKLLRSVGFTLITNPKDWHVEVGYHGKLIALLDSLTRKFIPVQSSSL